MQWSNVSFRYGNLPGALRLGSWHGTNGGQPMVNAMQDNRDALTDEDLRIAALRVAEWLPHDEAQARRVCDLAMILRRWVIHGTPLASAGSLSVVRDKPPRP